MARSVVTSRDAAERTAPAWSARRTSPARVARARPRAVVATVTATPVTCALTVSRRRTVPVSDVSSLSSVSASPAACAAASGWAADGSTDAPPVYHPTARACSRALSTATSPRARRWAATATAREEVARRTEAVARLRVRVALRATSRSTAKVVWSAASVAWDRSRPAWATATAASGTREIRSSWSARIRPSTAGSGTLPVAVAAGTGGEAAAVAARPETGGAPAMVPATSSAASTPDQRRALYREGSVRLAGCLRLAGSVRKGRKRSTRTPSGWPTAPAWCGHGVTVGTVLRPPLGSLAAPAARPRLPPPRRGRAVRRCSTTTRP